MGCKNHLMLPSTPGSLKALPVSLVKPAAYLNDRVIKKIPHYLLSVIKRTFLANNSLLVPSIFIFVYPKLS